MVTVAFQISVENVDYLNKKIDNPKQKQVRSISQVIKKFQKEKCWGLA